MDLLDRYLYEIKRYLPKMQQDDIVAEISDALQSEMEERESQLGRPLTDAEEAATIKTYGHPKIVASRYRPSQYLIGPETYPFYWYTMRIVLVTVLALELAGATIAALASTDRLGTFLTIVPIIWPSIFTVFGVVTVIFMIIEHVGSPDSVLVRLGVSKWDPRRLPRADVTEIPRLQILFEATVNIAFLLWLFDVPYIRHSFGFLLVGPLVDYFGSIGLNSSWHVFFAILIVATILTVVHDAVLFVHPYRTRLHAATLAFTNTLMAGAACIMLPVRDYVVISPAAHLHDAAGTTAAINLILFSCLAVFAFVCGTIAIVSLRTLLRRPDPALNISLGGVR